VSELFRKYTTLNHLIRLLEVGEELGYGLRPVDQLLQVQVEKHLHQARVVGGINLAQVAATLPTHTAAISAEVDAE
jgi:hypothetical protein